MRRSARLGVRRPVSLLRVDAAAARRARARWDGLPRSAGQLLEAVTTQEGATGVRAKIPGYRVAGKTGTAWKASNGSYSRDRYTSVFAGVAPASNPRLAAVVVIDDPTAGKYMGGDVSAPVFSAVVGGALRLLAVAPDDTSIPSGAAESRPEGCAADELGRCAGLAAAQGGARRLGRCA